MPAIFLPKLPKAKMKPYRNKKILNHARGQHCTIRHPHHCTANPEETVFAHLDELWAGKGYGQKAHDFAGAFACSGCHDWLHGPGDPDKLLLLYRGNIETLYILFSDGVIK